MLMLWSLHKLEAKACRMRWNASSLLCMISLFGLTVFAQPKRTFTLEDDRFVRDGKPIQLISGRSVMHTCSVMHLRCGRVGP